MKNTIGYFHVWKDVLISNNDQSLLIPGGQDIKLLHYNKSNEYFIVLKGEKIPIIREKWYTLYDSCHYILPIKNGHIKDREKKLNFLFDDQTTSH